MSNIQRLILAIFLGAVISFLFFRAVNASSIQVQAPTTAPSLKIDNYQNADYPLQPEPVYLQG